MPGNRSIYETAMKKADSLAWDRKFKEAITEYRRALEEFPNDVAARTSLAATLRKLGALNEAVIEYANAVKLAPENLRLLNLLAEVQQQAGNREASAQTYSRIALLQQREQNPQAAVKSFQAAIQLDPKNIDAHVGLSIYYESQHRTDAAVNELLTVGRLLALQAKGFEAAEYVERAIKLSPNNPEAKELLQRIRAGRVRQSASQNPPAATPQTGLPSAGGEHGGGRKIDFQSLIGGNQAGTAPGIGLSSVPLPQMPGGVAIPGAKRKPQPLGVAIQNFAQPPEALMQAAQQAENEGQPYIAISLHEAILHQVPDNTSSAMALGGLYRRVEQPEQAVRYYQMAAAAPRLKRRAMTGLGVALREAGRLDEALPVLEEVANQLDLPALSREEASEAWTAARALAECYLARGETAKTTNLSRIFIEHGGAQGWNDIANEVRRWGLVLNGYDNGAWWEDVPVLPSSERLAAIDAMIRSYELIEAKLWRGAEEICLSTISRNPDFLPVHIRQGEIYRRQQRNEAALAKYSNVIDVYAVRGETIPTIAMYKRVLELTPDNITMRARLAKLLFDNRRFEESAQESLAVAASYTRVGQVERAMDEYRRIINLFPQNSAAYLAYGQTLNRLGRGVEALQAYNQALALDPHNVLAATMVVIGYALQNEWANIQPLFPQVSNAVRNDPAMAQKILKEVVDAADFYPDNPNLEYCLGAILVDMNRNEEAIPHFEQASKGNNAERTVLSQRALGRCYLDQGQVDRAIAQLRSVAHKTRGTGVLQMLADAYAQNDDLNESLNALLELRAISPNDENLRQHLAETYFKLGQLNQALSEYESVVTMYIASNRLDQAIATLQHMVEIAPSNLTVRTRLADLYSQQKQSDKALEVLGELADLQQRQNLTREAAGTLRTMISIVRNLDSKRALVLRQQIVKLMPRDVEARKDLIQAYIRIGNPTQALAEAAGFAKHLLVQRNMDDAIVMLRMALQVDPWNISALEQLAYAQLESGKLNEARDTLARLSGLAPNNLAAAALKAKLENRRGNESTDKPTQ